MKQLIRSLALCIFIVFISAFLVNAEGSLPVIMYHNVCTDSELVVKDETVHITLDRLEEHFNALQNAGYNAISLDEYYEYRRNGSELPDKPIIITFDDGYVSNYDYAYPLLKKYNMKACIFVIASRMGADNIEFPHFTWENAREMEQSGLVQIECHSFTHPDFSGISYVQTVLEMRLAKYAIDTNLSKNCRFFAYPYGKMNLTSTSVAELAGYDMVFVGRDINADLSEGALYEIPRYTVKGTWSGEELLCIIAE